MEEQCESKSDPWKVSLSLEGKPVNLHIDTGTEVTVITELMWQDIAQPTLSLSDRTLRGPDSRILPVKGKFTGIPRNHTQEVEEEIYVVAELAKPLLGRPAIKQLGLIQRVAAVDKQGLTPAQQFPPLFQGLGKLEGEYTTRLQEGAKPFALSTSRRVAIPLLKSVKQELQRMENLGVIVKVEQPTEWYVGMVVVPKPNGKVRICVDLTKLNESVQRE